MSKGRTPEETRIGREIVRKSFELRAEWHAARAEAMRVNEPTIWRRRRIIGTHQDMVAKIMLDAQKYAEGNDE